jgi:Fur family transcriptional regulator, ferric uptake regulator
MTRQRQAEPLEFSDIEDVAVELRKRGGRLSAVRRVVLEVLFAADGMVSADYIASHALERGSPLDVSSVYRNLDHLEELGVVRHMHAGHGPGLYGLTSRSEGEYLACARCGRVTVVAPGELDQVKDAIRERFGYEASFDHFPIVGLCADCAAKQR